MHYINIYKEHIELLWGLQWGYRGYIWVLCCDMVSYMGFSVVILKLYWVIVGGYYMESFIVFQG